MMHSLTWCARIWLWESAFCEFDGRRVGLAQFGFVDWQVVDGLCKCGFLAPNVNWRIQECAWVACFTSSLLLRI
jgi:hypothetical protein